jgi:hypothetical protein
MTITTGTRTKETAPMTATRSPWETARRSAPGRAVTELGKRALRRSAMLDPRDRPAPDFLVIGSKRGGTTSLWAYLSEHPGVLPLFPRAEKIKGTYFFDEQWGRGTDWYLSHFPTRARREKVAQELGYRPVSGEASPYYLFHPLAPERARQVAPDALVIAVLRDPVERAYSHWKERRNHTEALPFEDALRAEAERTAGEEQRILDDPTYISFPHRHQTYVAQSRYSPMLRRWFDVYGRDSVLVEAAETFYADPAAFLGRITDRLGLPTVTGIDLSPRNAEPSAAMTDEARSFLEAELRPDIEETQRLLGRELPW